MHGLIEIKAAAATRDLLLKNLETGTVDICFDYSALVSFDNFNFMQVGKQYDCKISLFGALDKEGIELRYLRDVKVGLKNISEVVSAAGDIYYVGRDDRTKLSLSESLINRGDSFVFYAWRKDLIQVGDTVHANFFED
ncbi:MAG: hypothetical protein LBU31_04250 [Coriobacteriales bacterium]|jgi:hypothetical protein|nr:hypothetical protein [Coriobacteriales bacterium]